MNWLVVGVGLALLAWRLAAAIGVAADARRHGCARWRSVGWGLVATLAPDTYWWGGRLGYLTADEARRVEREAARAHGLESVANVRCPLCEAELVEVLSLAPSGGLAIAPGARCPRCDFRLDACRHCEHFLPATDPIGGLVEDKDFSHGRCGRYRTRQPVREAYPQLAAQMERMGLDSLPAPTPVADSYIPLDGCTAYAVDIGHLRRNKVAWLTRQRQRLLRMKDEG